MHGFSYINRVGTASVHFGCREDLDESDFEELKRFNSGGHLIFKISPDGDSAEDVAWSLLSAIGEENIGQGFPWAILADNLRSLCDSASGILIIAKCPEIYDKFIPMKYANFIEHFLGSVHGFLKNDKPCHLVICDNDAYAIVP